MSLVKIREYKPQRKTQKVVDIVLQLVSKYNIPLSVRQVHYLLVGIPEAGHENTVDDYQKTSRIVTDMRYGGLLDWEKIVDETRTIYKTESFTNIDEALELLFRDYRKDRWADSEYYIEAWVEKKTLVRQFYSITNEYDIYLAAGGGFSSTTYIYEAVKRLGTKCNEDKEIVILYFGDLDPSGNFMNEDIKQRIKEWGIPLTIHRIALNNEHVREYNLSKKFNVPVKYGSEIKNKIKQDPRARMFYEEYGELFQVELEALDPEVLSSMLENSILDYVDREQHDKMKQVEKREVEAIKRKLYREK